MDKPRMSLRQKTLRLRQYAKAPKTEEIKAKLLEILGKIELDPKQKDLILKLRPALQWRLICRHNEFLKQNEDKIEKASKSDAQVYIDKIKNSPSLITLQGLRRWFDFK